MVWTFAVMPMARTCVRTRSATEVYPAFVGVMDPASKPSGYPASRSSCFACATSWAGAGTVRPRADLGNPVPDDGASLGFRVTQCLAIEGRTDRLSDTLVMERVVRLFEAQEIQLLNRCAIRHGELESGNLDGSLEPAVRDPLREVHFAGL